MLKDSELMDELIQPILDSNAMPQFGTGSGVSKEEFLKKRSSDPLYSVVGLDTTELYTAHSGGSVLTSAYRQLGIGLERAMRMIATKGCDFIDVPDNNQNNLKWFFSSATGATRELDLLISIDMINQKSKKKRLYEIARLMKPKFKIQEVDFKGIVFEIRQGYQSADSKRVKGDLEIVEKAEEEGLLAVVLIGSNSYNQSVISTYKSGGLPILVPSSGGNGKVENCPYCFFEDFMDYDLRSAMLRIAPEAKAKVTKHVRTRLGLD